ncbi:jg8465 [Pararge aegeria aegeria]|uniref:Jg8465 protein n=1 Tax=Pararge aegeria aegeria TaxID=348720 RepID=A0A8S4RVH8_9NEOP|nr:jg8465 [Pararge aegeria aegeria]
MWCWKRMLRIPWNAFRTILEELCITQRLSFIVQAILTFFATYPEETTTPLNVWLSNEESRPPDHAEDRP